MKHAVMTADRKAEMHRSSLPDGNINGVGVQTKYYNYLAC